MMYQINLFGIVNNLWLNRTTTTDSPIYDSTHILDMLKAQGYTVSYDDVNCDPGTWTGCKGNDFIHLWID